MTIPSIVPESQKKAVQEIMISTWSYFKKQAELATKNMQEFSYYDFMTAISQRLFLCRSVFTFTHGYAEFYTLKQPSFDPETQTYKVLTHNDLGIDVLRCANRFESQKLFLSMVDRFNQTTSRKFYVPDLSYWLFISNPNNFARIPPCLKNMSKYFYMAGVAFRYLDGRASVPVVRSISSSFDLNACGLDYRMGPDGIFFALEISS